MSKATNTVIPIDLGGVNSYLITTEGGFVLADTGGHLVMDKAFDNRREKLLQALAGAGCEKGKLRLVLLTHGDCDHAANAAAISRTFGAPVALHPGDRELVAAPTLEKMMASFHYRSVMLRLVFRLMKDKIKKVTKKTLDDFERFEPDISLTDGMNLAQYGVSGQVIHLPGHTAGSVGVLLADGSLIAGDTFVNNGKPSPAPNADDFGLLKKSIEGLRNRGVKTVYPGHGKPFAFSKLEQ